MWIPQVSMFAPTFIEGLRPETIQAGIHKRLALLTALFCPDEEEDPDLVLRRLRVEAVSQNELKIRWRERMRYPTRLYKFGAELGPPPYDWSRPARTKEVQIAAAIEATCEQLGEYLTGIVPVCTAKGKEYGVEENLLPAITELLDELHAVALLRCI